MSAEIKVGTTIDEAMKFAFSNLLNVIRVGWFPIALTMAATAAVAWVFWQPVIIAYIDLIQQISTAGAEATAEDLDTSAVEAAILQTGFGQFALGYVLFLVVALFGYAIPLTAYSRMIVTGENPRGPLYFRLGGREIGVGVTYLVITLILLIAMTIAIVALSIVGGLIAAAAGEGGGLIAGLLVFISVVAMVVFSVWLFARLMLALPIAAVEGGIPIGRTWSLGRGHGGALALAFVLGYLLLTVFMLLGGAILGLATGIIGTVLQSMGSELFPYIVGALWGFGYVAIYCVSTAFVIALFAGPYRRLTHDPAEAF